MAGHELLRPPLAEDDHRVGALDRDGALLAGAAAASSSSSAAGEQEDRDRERDRGGAHGHLHGTSRPRQGMAAPPWSFLATQTVQSRFRPRGRRLLRRPQRAEAPEQQEVVGDLESARDVEGSAGGSHEERRPHPGRERRTQRSSDRGDARGGGALVGGDHGDGVGLSRGHVHLRDRRADQVHRRREPEARHPRHRDEQDVRREVGEDHRVHEPEPGGEAVREQRRERGEHVREEEEGAQERGARAEAGVEPVSQDALQDEAAGERVESEERAQSRHDSTRTVEAEDSRAGRRRTPRRLDRRRERGEQEREEHSDPRVAREHHAVGVDLREPAELEQARDPAAGERPERRRDRAGHAVPGEQARAIAVERQLREGGLLDREEGTDLAPARADHADDRGEDEHPGLAGPEEDETSRRHEEGAEQEHAPAPHAVGAGGDPQGDRGVSEKRGSEEEARRGPVEPDRAQVEHEHDRERAVGEEPRDSRGEQQAHVPHAKAPWSLPSRDHPLAIRVERVVDDPFRRVELVVVLDSRARGSPRRSP